MVRNVTDFTSYIINDDEFFITDDEYVITDDHQKVYRSPMTLERTSSSIVVHVPVHPALTVQSTQSQKHAVSRRPPVSLIVVGFEAITQCGTHSGPVLAAVLGFAALSAVIQSFGLLTGVTPASNPLLYVCLTAFGLPLYALAQGAVAWFGLVGYRSATQPSMKTAVRTALGQWRPLLFGALTHAVLTFISGLGFASLLLSGRLQMYANPNDVMQVVTSRSIDAVALGLQHPFTPMMEPARQVLALLPIDHELPVYQPYFALAKLDRMYAPPPPSPRLGNWAMLASLALLIAVETLLRFSVVAAMRTSPPARLNKWGIFSPLILSFQLVVRNFRPVMASTWGLRLAAGLVQIALVILPMVYADLVILPQLPSLPGASWMGLACRLAGGVAGAIVCAYLTAFCTLYDARLFVALQRPYKSK